MSNTSPDWHHEWPGSRMLGGLRRRAVASVAAVTGWISFALLFVAFWASHFTLFQSVVLLVVSLLVLFGLLVGMWISFGLRFGNAWSD